MKKQPAAAPPADPLGSWRIALWLIFFGGTLFFWPACLDRYLAPRFFFLSAALLVSGFLVWKDVREKGDWRLHGFDLLLLGWYGLNLASLSWAFSWSEGVFYAQKTLLLFGVYWFARQALLRSETMVRQTLRQLITVMTWMVSAILLVQVGLAFTQHGLDNEKLYDYAFGVFGNKSLAADFLFFLLVFNVLLYREQARRSDFWLAAGMLTVLIVLLQTRTVYLALGVCGILYSLVRATFESDFRRIFIRKLLPAGLVVLALGIGLVALKGRGNSLAERLNPLTYLDSDSANERRFVWYKTDLLNQDHVWLGVGDGSWKFWFPSKNIEGGYRMEEKNVVFTRAHNDYLEIRSELGLIGAAWFCALFLLVFFAALWAMRKKRAADGALDHDLLVAALGVLGYCIIQFFDFPRERIEMQAVLALFFAWIMYYGRPVFQLNLAINGVARLAFFALAGLGLAFNLLIGWNRMAGEKQNVRMLEAQAKGDWKTLAQASVAAENPFYEYTEVSIPLAWHEGIAWYQLKQMDKAVVAFEKAYKLNPWSFQVMNNYASALVQTNRFRESIPLFEQALKINPRFDDGKLNVSFAYFQLGEYEQARDWIERVDTIPNPANDDDRRKNQQIKTRQADFRKAIQEKMK